MSSPPQVQSDIARVRPCSLDDAFAAVEEAISPTYALVHPSKKLFFLFGFALFATIEPRRKHDSFAFCLARYPKGGRGLLMRKLRQQGYRPLSDETA